MKHADFLIWMIFFPAIQSSIDFVRKKYGLDKKFDKSTEALASIIYLSIYFFIGYKLF